jgi:hypothetical protein
MKPHPLRPADTTTFVRAEADITVWGHGLPQLD